MNLLVFSMIVHTGHTLNKKLSETKYCQMRLETADLEIVVDKPECVLGPMDDSWEKDKYLSVFMIAGRHKRNIDDHVGRRRYQRRVGGTDAPQWNEEVQDHLYPAQRPEQI